MSRSSVVLVRPRRLRSRHWRRAAVHTWSEAAELVETIIAALRAARFSKQDVFAVRLALDEALANAIKHGHDGDLTKTVRVHWRLRAGDVLICVRDEGPGFDREIVPDPRAEDGLERDCGRGLLLMQLYLTHVRFNHRGNAVLLHKIRSTH
jgi:serine/threonine-protein kinase RsbW